MHGSNECSIGACESSIGTERPAPMLARIHSVIEARR